MADKKITALTELTAPASDDILVSVDVSDTTDSLNGTTKKITKANLQKDLNDIENAEYSAFEDNGNSSAADTIDWTLKTGQKSTLTADCTYTFTAPITTDGWARIMLKVSQDTTGGWDVTFPSNVIWTGPEPTWVDGTASQVMYITFIYDAERDKYIGSGTDWDDV